MEVYCMKRLLAVFLMCFLLSSIFVSAEFIEDSIDYSSEADDVLNDAKKYEKSIEGVVNGTFKWYPYSEGEFDAEYGVDYQLGESSNPSNFSYFYDTDSKYLVQIYRGSKTVIIMWRDKEPYSYVEI